MVTGAAGFLGTHVVEQLLRDDHSPIAIDNFEGAQSRQVKQWYVRETRRQGRFDLHEIDVSEYTQTLDVVRDVLPDAVVHLAGRHYGELRDLHRVNVTGTLNLLEACRRAGVKRFVLASSWEVYGAEKPPFDEQRTPLRPRSILGLTKSIAERYAAVYARLFHIRSAVLRFFPLYGPRQRPDMVFALAARSAVKKEPARVSDHPDNKQDYTFVEDAAEAVSLALGREEEFGVFNVGTGVATKLKDALDALESAFGAKPHLTLSTGSDVRIDGHAGTRRAQQSLGFKAKIRLEAGLKRYADWYAHMRPTVRMVK